MRNSFKKVFMSLTILSSGFVFYTPDVADAAYASPEKKPVYSNKSFKQYPVFGEAKSDINFALDLHKMAVSLLSEKQQLEKYKESIEKYDEIVRRLNQNESCNKSQLSEHFENGADVWNKASAWAKDSAAKLLADSSGAFGEVDEKQTKAADMNMNANMSEAELRSLAPETSSDDAPDVDISMDDAAAFGKIRWDVGSEVLKDIYANPDAWGKVKKQFSPWVDQKFAYTNYLKNRYDEYLSEYEKSLNPLLRVKAAVILKAFPIPSINVTDSFIPKDHIGSDVVSPVVPVAPSIKVFKHKLEEDKVWYTSATSCQFVGKGSVFDAHKNYIRNVNLAIHAFNSGTGQATNPLHPAPLSNLPLIEIDAPCVPMTVLPPWRETAYIMGVDKQIPQLSSGVPEPWEKIIKRISYFSPYGEMANLVEKNSNTLRYRPEDYNRETFEVKENADGTPRLPIPLMANRVSSYLQLISAKEEQEPIKDKAVASIKELNESVLTTFSKAGYDFPNASTFSLVNDSDYEMALEKVTEIQNEKMNAAKAKFQKLNAEYAKSLLPSIVQMIEEENVTMDALKQDSEFLIEVSRDNAKEINSLLMTAIADATANQKYKDNVEEQMKDSNPIPAVGCPVL